MAVTTKEPDMDDESFLGYCELHCRTERALFSWAQIQRLAQLAGAPADPQQPSEGWARAGVRLVQPLVDEARRRLRDAFVENVLARGFVEGDLQ